jgi:hypothetical protein
VLQIPLTEEALMRGKSIHIRLEHDDYEQLVKLAGSLKTTPSAAARTLVLQGIGPFDRKHEALLYRIEQLTDLLHKTGVLAASSIASSAMSPVWQDVDEKAEKQRLRAHIKRAVKYGKEIDVAWDEGKLDEADTPVSSGHA